ncbi:transcriptional regulator [Acinetobacter gerneri]|uniref:helix-turn-helix domain-containing protein n=1 Tax=Acinetobacter gerneri TaxID=202952 RepID=UPI0029359617|nr:helix-turn-helix domain-containing protein [Acinetobacter gerneri]MDV2440612.1 transcriptional regulator [Acinetobacter gerneri]
MNIKPIKNDHDLDIAFLRLEKIFQAEEGTPEADEMEVLVTLIEAYEQKHYSIQHADPIAAIRFQMEQLNLEQKDLEPYLGVPSKISEVLSGKRPLSLNMIKKLHNGLKIPYESLIC